MKYTVLSVAYPLTQVGPDAAGGSEQILTALDAALAREGHRSLVLAADGSRVSGELIPSPRAGKHLDDAERHKGRRAHDRLIRKALGEYQIDLIHMHSLDFHNYLPPMDIPVLATLHLPPDWYPGEVFSNRQQLHLNCVSTTQRKSCPPSTCPISLISNGVDVTKFDATSKKADFALALGRICPEKGFHLALDAARLAGVELVLAGEIFPYESHVRYFKEEIAPRLDAKRRFIGPVGFRKKRRLLAEAKCLLVPSTVAETSSLVAMEALASGTPVIAFRSGALPEIIEDGLTGYVVSNANDMAAALAKVDLLDPKTCRRVACKRFGLDRMIAGYLDLYRQIISDNMIFETDMNVSSRLSWLV